MSFAVACQCGQQFLAEEHLRGQTLPCPSCTRPILIQPAGQPRTQAAAPAAQRPAQPKPAAPKPAAAAPAKEIPVACLCGRSYAAPASYAGKVLSCPACGNGIQVPQSASPFAGAPAPAAHDPFADPFAAPISTGGSLGAAPAPAQSSGMNPMVLWGAVGGGGVFVVVAITVAIVLSMGNKPAPQNTLVAENNAAVPVVPAVTTPSPVVTPPVTATTGLIPVAPGGIAGPNAANVGTNGGEKSPFVETTASSKEASPFEEVASNKGPSPKAAEDANPFEEATPMGPQPKTIAKAAVTSSASSPAEEAVKSIGLEGAASVDFDLGRMPGTLKRWNLNKEGKPLVGAIGTIKVTDPIFFKHSWMCELLPQLGHQKIYDELKMDKSSVEKESIKVGRNEIPEFLNPADDNKRTDALLGQMAVTHFVGMAGLEDSRTTLAAQLPRTDPRAGVFGYDEVVPANKIKDGAANTIMIIGSGGMPGPWIMAGGSTIRGARAPAFDKITGFGTKGLKKEGAVVVMADGSVRQISADVDVKVFRAMCTVGGADSIDLKDPPAAPVASVKKKK